MCSDQEAVELVRNIQSPQEASKVLVEHALGKFSTDNLSVMVVRFNSQKVRDNTSLDIGVEHETGRDKTAISEVEMIVSEARRNSGIPPGGVALSDGEQEEINSMIIKEEQEEQEAGPEMTEEGRKIAQQQLQARNDAGGP